MRKLLTLILMGLAFYGGLTVERSRNEARCVNEGGIVDARGLCTGADE